MQKITGRTGKITILVPDNRVYDWERAVVVAIKSKSKITIKSEYTVECKTETPDYIVDDSEISKELDIRRNEILKKEQRKERKKRTIK